MPTIKLTRHQFSLALHRFRYLLPFVLLLLLLTNFLLPMSPFGQAKLNILQNPTSQDRVFLAQQLLSTNQLAAAKHELDQIPNPAPDAQKLLNEVQHKSSEPEKIKVALLFWQKVSEEFSNYRDAYLSLALLNWKLYRLFDAQKYLEKVLEIDPNNEAANKLRGEIP